MKFPSLRHSLMALAMAAGMSAGSASAVTITREFTANWFDPSHSGHGFGIEVIDAPVGKTLSPTGSRMIFRASRCGWSVPAR